MVCCHFKNVLKYAKQYYVKIMDIFFHIFMKTFMETITTDP